jgi:hypothetical protein
MYSPETLETLGTQDTGQTVGITPSVSLRFIYYQLYVLCLVYPMLPVSLDCTCLIASLIFL